MDFQILERSLQVERVAFRFAIKNGLANYSLLAFSGNIYPDELIISKDPEYHSINKKNSDMLGMWKKKLSEDDCKQLEVFMDLRSEASLMEVSE